MSRDPERQCRFPDLVLDQLPLTIVRGESKNSPYMSVLQGLQALRKEDAATCAQVIVAYQRFLAYEMVLAWIRQRKWDVRVDTVNRGLVKVRDLYAEFERTGKWFL